MADKELEQLIDDLKKQLGSVSPQNLGSYEKKGDDFVGKGKFDEAAAVYEQAAKVAPEGHPVHKKRHDALANSLGVKKNKPKKR
jgi:tetratricopeptide (TPR) repeat protein